MVGARMVVLVAVALVSAGCASDVVDEPPEDPTAFDYVYRADSDRKAPHSVSGVTAFQTLRSTQGTFVLEATMARVLAPPSPMVPPGAPGPSMDLPGALVVLAANGIVTTAAGDEVALEGRDIRVNASGAWDLHGLQWVRSGAIDVEDGRATVQGLGPPIRSEGDRPIVVGVQIGVAPGGASASGVHVHERAAGTLIASGDLLLEQGGYDIAEGRLSVAPTEPIEGRGPGNLELTGAPSAVLNDREVPWPSWSVDVVDGSFSADAVSGEVTLALSVQQLYANGRPQFEGALVARFQGLGPEHAVTLSPGENTTLWVEVAETSAVGSVPNTRPRLDEGGLEATYGFDWYASPDPNLIEELGKAFKQAIFGLFIDFTHTYFKPLQTQYIPLYVEAPNGTAPGAYTVTGHFNGDTARSNDWVLTVTVT